MTSDLEMSRRWFLAGSLATAGPVAAPQAGAGAVIVRGEPGNSYRSLAIRHHGDEIATIEGFKTTLVERRPAAVVVEARA